MARKANHGKGRLRSAARPEGRGVIVAPVEVGRMGRGGMVMPATASARPAAARLGQGAGRAYAPGRDAPPPRGAAHRRLEARAYAGRRTSSPPGNARP